MRTLLALDDCAVTLQLRVAIFEPLGFRVLRFLSGRSALECLAVTSVDVIVTDYEMPDLNGVAFAKQARLLGYEGGIVMSSGALQIEPVHRFWIDDVVVKASPMQALIEAVVRALEINHGRKESRGTVELYEAYLDHLTRFALRDALPVSGRGTGALHSPSAECTVYRSFSVPFIA